MVRSRDVRNREKATTTEPVVQTITKPIGGDKNGGERVVTVKKGPKWHPGDDVKKPVPSRKGNHNPTKLRSKITPGTVVILLSGASRGARAIFLKQLSSGLLLVTGPYSVNRIPLRRVNQRYVIATSTKVDVGGVDVSKFDDVYFKKSGKKEQAVVMETDEGDASKNAATEAKVADQKAVDDALVPVVEKEPFLQSYLKSKFTLSKGQYPHEMVF